MKIACLSGKGGAGKTFTAVNLATAAEQAVYIDCDVEEPNGRLFLKPEQMEERIVSTLLPKFDEKRCTGCKKCVEFCHFHALIYIKDKPKVFPEVCHSCGGCKIVCPEGTVTEEEKPIGKIETGFYKNIRTVTGVLNPGEASGVPIIREALKEEGELIVIDCPPGSSCSVMESVMDADFCILVVEPTAFGFHNFQMVYELTTLLNKTCGVVINKYEEPYPPLETFCQERNLPILARIPYDETVAAMTAIGEIAAEKDTNIRSLFQGILKQIGGAL